MSFASLKKNRTKQLEDLQKKILDSKKGYKDPDEDKYWQPTADNAGNGFAIIRFLPGKDGDDPYIKMWTHGFKDPGTGRWYIENCLTTIGKDDPVTDANSVFWKTGTEENKKIAQRQKRRLHYESNILVIEDPGNPDNEGKVFKYKYGQTIFDKLNDKMNPQFAGDKPMNPFDFWDGANFRLKIVKKDGYRNYDKSEFDSPSAVFDDDEKIETIYNQLYDLKEALAADKFKSYEELQKKYLQVIGMAEGGKSTGMSAEDLANSGKIDEPREQKKEAVAKAEPVKKAAEIPVAEDDDDDLAMFAAIAQQVKGQR